MIGSITNMTQYSLSYNIPKIGNFQFNNVVNDRAILFFLTPDFQDGLQPEDSASQMSLQPDSDCNKFNGKRLAAMAVLSGQHESNSRH